MLFDLKGRRRHVVQGTYLLLALLMGGGLVLFGIGGGTSGGLLDAFKGGGGSSNGNSIIQKRIDAAERRLALNPRDRAAMAEIIKDHYQLAGQDVDAKSGTYNNDGKAELAKASAVWDRYLAVNPKKPDESLARFMVQVYSPTALNKPSKAQKAAEIVSAADPSPQAFLQVVQYAALAGDTRTAKLAGQRAVALAPKSERSSVKALVKQTETTTGSSTQSGSGAQSGSGG